MDIWVGAKRNSEGIFSWTETGEIYILLVIQKMHLQI